MERCDFPLEMRTVPVASTHPRDGSSSTAPQAHSSSHAIQEELDHFQVPGGGWKVVSPGVESMLPDQVGEAKGMRVALPVSLHFFPQRGDILRVLEDGHPKSGLVGGDPLESFQEFVSFQEDAALSKEHVG